jgi:hypothetical protein
LTIFTTSFSLADEKLITAGRGCVRYYGMFRVYICCRG